MTRTFVAIVIAASVSLSLSVADANGTSKGAPATGAAGGAAADGKKLFTSGTTPSCATCHVLRDAKATGNIGPDLDALKPDAACVRNAVQNGFENMPAFGHVLNTAQIDALAQYVQQAAGTAK